MLTDALGSVIALADSSGSVQTEYTYDAFGKTTFTGASNDNPYQYTGRENDGTSLYYYRARYYHPELQRFISEDPLGFSGSGVNYFTYVANNSINFTDPLGLLAPGHHYSITRNAAINAGCGSKAADLGRMTANVDTKPGSQDRDNAHWHGMCSPQNANNPEKGQQLIDNYIQGRLASCKLPDLADALHAAQDRHAPAHRGCQPWYGPIGSLFRPNLFYHYIRDNFPDAASFGAALADSQRMIQDFMQRCPCACQ
jgi:RHS repeat-associated protein